MNHDNSREALYFPATRLVFRGLSPRPAFDPADTDFSLINCWWLANMCHLAYYQPEALEEVLGELGLKLDVFCSNLGMQAFMASTANWAVIAFRGTQIDEFWDIATDAEFLLIPNLQEVKVHHGFAVGIEAIWPRLAGPLDDAVRHGKHLWYTGYSLGAALATLAAVRLPPEALVTFGSPRVGTAELGKLLAGIPHARFVNCCDIVPTVPFKEWGYQHTGTHFFFTDSSELLREPTPDLVSRAKSRGTWRYRLGLPWLRPNLVSDRSWADHAIVNYTANLLRQLGTLVTSRTVTT